MGPQRVRHDFTFTFMDCSLPGSSVHGISQARFPTRILEWIAIWFSKSSYLLSPYFGHMNYAVSHSTLPHLKLQIDYLSNERSMNGRQMNQQTPFRCIMPTTWTIAVYRTTAPSFMEHRLNHHPYSKKLRFKIHLCCL